MDETLAGGWNAGTVHTRAWEPRPLTRWQAAGRVEEVGSGATAPGPQAHRSYRQETPRRSGSLAGPARSADS